MLRRCCGPVSLRAAPTCSLGRSSRSRSRGGSPPASLMPILFGSATARLASVLAAISVILQTCSPVKILPPSHRVASHTHGRFAEQICPQMYVITA